MIENELEKKIYSIYPNIGEFFYTERCQMAHEHREKEYILDIKQENVFYFVSNENVKELKDDIIYVTDSRYGIYADYYSSKLFDVCWKHLSENEIIYKLKVKKQLNLFNNYNKNHINEFYKFVNECDFEKEKKEAIDCGKNRSQFYNNHHACNFETLFDSKYRLLKIINVLDKEITWDGHYMSYFEPIIRKLGFDGYIEDKKIEKLYELPLPHKGTRLIFNPKDCFDIIDRENIMDLWDERIKKDMEYSRRPIYFNGMKIQ